MRFSLVAAAVASAFVSVAASPVVITETLPPWGNCYAEETTFTATATVPGATATYHDPATTTSTSTKFVYPTNNVAKPSVAPRTAFDEETTIVEIQTCSETIYGTPTSTFTDPHITATTTVFASTSVVTETYTLCVGDHICARDV